MKAVILAGGLGTRLSEETTVRPKPMVEIGGKPILWHVMKGYSAYGINDFIICLGYKGYVIKEYFANYFLHNSDLTFDIKGNKMEILQASSEPWRVSLIDTGESTMTGGRLKRVAAYVGEDTFCFTYGDGVASVDIGKSIEYHRSKGVLATLTSVQPPGRFGALSIKDDKVAAFREKPEGGGWVNGGFFVLSPRVIDYIEGDSTVWERGPLEKLASEGQLAAYKHEGFWQPMDTLRDKVMLEEIWASGKPPWKTWK
jgi:glucose-1-phosphate cytidylyltransferase